jgi:hypothetical protein
MNAKHRSEIEKMEAMVKTLRREGAPASAIAAMNSKIDNMRGFMDQLLGELFSGLVDSKTGEAQDPVVEIPDVVRRQRLLAGGVKELFHQVGDHVMRRRRKRKDENIVDCTQHHKNRVEFFLFYHKTSKEAAALILGGNRVATMKAGVGGIAGAGKLFSC